MNAVRAATNPTGSLAAAGFGEGTDGVCGVGESLTEFGSRTTLSICDCLNSCLLLLERVDGPLMVLDACVSGVGARKM
jgi:hypothetical protein